MSVHEHSEHHQVLMQDVYPIRMPVSAGEQPAGYSEMQLEEPTQPRSKTRMFAILVALYVGFVN